MSEEQKKERLLKIYLWGNGSINGNSLTIKYSAKVKTGESPEEYVINKCYAEFELNN